MVEYDRIQRENRNRKESAEQSEPDDAALLAEVEESTITPAPDGAETSATAPILNRQAGEDSDEYEEVEVTDDEDEENPPKRQKTDNSDGEQPVEFNEDDIAYQLAAMGQDYGLDPGEYDDGQDEDLEEGAEGLALTEDDAGALFRDMLNDYNINPYTPWEQIIERGEIVQDDRYLVLSNMRSRKDVWGEWTRTRIQQLKEQREKEEKKDPRLPYMALLEKFATPKLYWPEFRRKYKKEPEMKDGKLVDKEREKLYREYINRTSSLIWACFT